MRKLYSLGSLVLFISFSTLNAQDVKVPVDTTIVTTHSATIKGKNIPYTATTGFQPVWDEQGKPVATLNYTFYQRSDIKNKENRPLVISFNGGPGSASVWMHIAYTGPRVLKIDDEVFEFIVDKAEEFDLGARGLRTICEAIMVDAMFELPSSDEKEFYLTLSYAKEKLSRKKLRKLRAVS